MPVQKQTWSDSLNLSAERLLRKAGESVDPGKFPLGEAFLVGFSQGWRPNKSQDPSDRVLLRMSKLGDANSPQLFLQSLLPFLGSPERLADLEAQGLPRLSLESLDQYVPQNLEDAVKLCRSLPELLNTLELQEWEVEREQE
jgi:hypothetical protein